MISTNEFRHARMSMLVLADNCWAGLLVPGILVILFTL